MAFFRIKCQTWDCIYYNQYNIKKLATLFNVEEKEEPRL